MTIKGICPKAWIPIYETLSGLFTTPQQFFRSRKPAGQTRNTLAKNGLAFSVPSMEQPCKLHSQPYSDIDDHPPIARSSSRGQSSKYSHEKTGPAHTADLGCASGGVTELQQQREPQSSIVSDHKGRSGIFLLCMFHNSRAAPHSAGRVYTRGV